MTTRNPSPRVGNKDMRRIVRIARLQGWEISIGAHVKFYNPDGRLIVTASLSGGPHEIKSTTQRLRKAGLVLARGRS